MLKNEKIKFFLSIAVVLAVAGLLIWRGIFVINNEVNNSINALKDKKIFRDVYALKESTMDQEMEDYNFSKNKFDTVNNYFVYASDNDDTEFTAFFGQLDNIALLSTQKEKSLVIDLYQTELAVPVKGAKKPSAPADSSVKEDSRLLRLTLKSDFEGLLKFISRLEAMPYYVYIESVNINADNSVKEKTEGLAVRSINLQTSIIIKVFRKTTIL